MIARPSDRAGKGGGEARGGACGSLAARSRGVIDDWSLVNAKKIKDLQAVFLDFEGFRYHPPARMLAAMCR